MNDDFSSRAGDMDKELLCAVDANLERLKGLVRRYKEKNAALDTIRLSISENRSHKGNVELMDSFLAVADDLGNLDRQISALLETSFKHLYEIEDPDIQVAKGTELMLMACGMREGRPPGTLN